MALFATERTARASGARSRFPHPRRRTLVPVVVALVLLTSLVAVAAAQPVVVRAQLVNERADAQAFFVFDTSLSMKASGGRGDRTGSHARNGSLSACARARRRPIGIASMTDRTLPNLMPTTDASLFTRTLVQSVGIDRPPPSQAYHLEACDLVPGARARRSTRTSTRRVPTVGCSWCSPTEKHRSSSRTSTSRCIAGSNRSMSMSGATASTSTGWSRRSPLRLRPDQRGALKQLATITGGNVYSEGQQGSIARAMRDAVGFGGTRAHINAYARIALAPWLVLAGALPLAFLLWRRNV